MEKIADRQYMKSHKQTVKMSVALFGCVMYTAGDKDVSKICETINRLWKRRSRGVRRCSAEENEQTESSQMNYIETKIRKYLTHYHTKTNEREEQ